ncbi:hypothetical protein Gotri_011895, partial [Gossypium trilobum]|nr:hypothetical protein [Gossypium trilobum]
GPKEFKDTLYCDFLYRFCFWDFWNPLLRQFYCSRAQRTVSSFPAAIVTHLQAWHTIKLPYMWFSLTNGSIRILRCCVTRHPTIPSQLSRFPALHLLENTVLNNAMSSFSSFAHSNRSGGRGQDMKYDRERSGGRGGSKDKIDALGRLLTRILRHMATELNLNMRSDGYVKVEDLLKLNMRTFANIPLRSQTVDDIKEVEFVTSFLVFVHC